MTTRQPFKNKYSLQVRERDHSPPHVHICGGGVDAMIDLETLACTGLIPAEVKKEIIAWITVNHSAIMEEWHKWHK